MVLVDLYALNIWFEDLCYWDCGVKACCVCRCPVEPVLQRQPEGEAVQRSFIRTDGESTGSSVQQHPTEPLWERNLLQHNRLPQVTPQKIPLHSLPCALPLVWMQHTLMFYTVSLSQNLEVDTFTEQPCTQSTAETDGRVVGFAGIWP